MERLVTLLGTPGGDGSPVPEALTGALATAICSAVTLDVRAQAAVREAPPDVVDVLRRLAADPLAAASGAQEAAQGALEACGL